MKFSDPVILVSFGIAIFVATINSKVFSDNLKMNKKITMREDFQDIKRLIESSIDCSKTAACSPNDPVNLKKADGSSVFELENTGSGNKRFGRYHKLRAICRTD